MGSLGSEKVNNILYKTMKNFETKDYEILFVTGNGSYDVMKEKKGVKQDIELTADDLKELARQVKEENRFDSF